MLTELGVAQLFLSTVFFFFPFFFGGGGGGVGGLADQKSKNRPLCWLRKILQVWQRARKNLCTVGQSGYLVIM